MEREERVPELRTQLDEALAAIRERGAVEAEIAIILGTGLNALAEHIEDAVQIPYADLPHFPHAGHNWHDGALVIGKLAGKRVAALSGRFHLYDGYTAQQVVFPVRVARALGCETLVVSNAAGGMNPNYKAGDLMVITDHINLMGDNPLIGPNDDSLGPRFPDMSEPYTMALVELAEEVALRQGVRLQRGVYLAVAGPCLETRAEYRYMRAIGGDAVGMSTVPEVIAAVHAGMRVLGFSAITDECLPDALEPADIQKIIAVANAVEPTLTRLVKECIERMER